MVEESAFTQFLKRAKAGEADAAPVVETSEEDDERVPEKDDRPREEPEAETGEDAPEVGNKGGIELLPDMGEKGMVIEVPRPDPVLEVDRPAGEEPSEHVEFGVERNDDDLVEQVQEPYNPRP